MTTTNTTEPPQLGGLTEKDFEMLMEALEVWERAPIKEGIQSTLMDSILSGPFVSPGEREAQLKKTMNEADNKARQRKSTVILLRAKIELARQALQARGIDEAKAAS